MFATLGKPGLLPPPLLLAAWCFYFLDILWVEFLDSHLLFTCCIGSLVGCSDILGLFLCAVVIFGRYCFNVILCLLVVCFFPSSSAF